MGETRRNPTLQRWRPIVYERALSVFLDSAFNGARRTQAALEAMAASARLGVVELENQAPVVELGPRPVQSVG